MTRSSGGEGGEDPTVCRQIAAVRPARVRGLDRRGGRGRRARRRRQRLVRRGAARRPQEIRIGARTNVQDNAVIHVDEPDFPTLIAEDVTVGHSAILHGCRVERGALVGMHATVLNGAVIGEEAVVAAGALVPPGMVVPPRTLVAGVPAKVRREVADRGARPHPSRGARATSSSRAATWLATTSASSTTPRTGRACA